MTRTLLLLSIATAMVGCGDSDPVLSNMDGGTDAGMVDPDAGPEPDPDAGPMPDPDAGPEPDAGPPPPACGDETVVAPTDPSAGSWNPGFNLPGVGGTAPADALALAVGPSGEIYVGGMFSHAGATPANNVVKWVDGGWEPLGAGIDGDVTALAVAPSGSPVYAAAMLHSTYESVVLAFDGTSWTQIGNFADGGLDEVEVGSDGKVYVGGLFGSVDGDTTIQNFAVWDGTTWSALGANPDSEVKAVLVDASGVCIGGHFANIGATPAQNVACWTGSSWTAYSLPLPFYAVYVLARDDGGNLLAGGHFTLDDSDTSQGGSLTRWTGAGWEYVGGGVHIWPGTAGYVEAITVVGSHIYVGGFFGQVGATVDDTRIQDIAMFDGTTWHDMGGAHRMMGIGLIEQNVWRLVSDSAGNVYMSGMFTAVGTKNASHVAMWDGSYWQQLAATGQLSAGVNGNINAMAARGDCAVYVGGDFTYAGDIVANNIARVDSTGWHQLGDGVSGYVSAIAVDSEGTVYAGGEFTGPGFYHLAKWDGTEWSGIGNTMGAVSGLAVDDEDNLYVSGEFSVAGDVVANNIAMWDGTDWHALGDGLDGPASALLFDDAGHLVVGGRFENAGGAPALNVARWDGSAWHAYGDGIPGWSGVRRLAYHDGQLLAGGSFDELTDGAKGIATWDGTAWVGWNGGLHMQYSWGSPYVNGLVSVGDYLFVFGFFSLVSGEEAVNAAYWDGTSWQPMGNGLNDVAEAAVGTNDGVWVGGAFTKADTTPSVGIAQWRYTP